MVEYLKQLVDYIMCSCL